MVYAVGQWRAVCLDTHAYNNPPLQATSGVMRLVAEASLLDALRQTCQSILDSQMFHGNTLNVNAIIERLHALENSNNAVE